MSLIRPELRAMITRYREFLWGALVFCFGLWIALAARGTIILALGGIVAALGGSYAITGVVRGALRRDRGAIGAGMVEITERELRFLSATGGRMLAFEDVQRITIITTARGSDSSDMFWEFAALGQPALRIPSDATGAEALFDMLSAFDGADYGAALAAAGSADDARFVIWQVTNSQPRLH